MATLAETPPKLMGEGAGLGRPGRLGPWLFGAALFSAVILVTAHWSEEHDFGLQLVRSSPRWLLLAALLQAATYAFQAGVWKAVLDRAGTPAPLWELYKLSVAKLFVDQAIPSAGMSGTVLIVHGLERRGVPRGPVMACVVVETITNSVAFVLALLLALALAGALGEVRPAIWIPASAFIVFSAALIAAVAFLSRGREIRLPGLLERVRGVRVLLRALAEAPPGLAHRPRVLLDGTWLNFAIHLLDAGTLWALLHSVGADASPPRVFTAFMFATLARTVGVVPGGLGVFEVASIGSMNLMGVPLGAALAGTLLFRGFSFWVPLAPGLWLSRAELRRQRDARRGPVVDHYWSLPVEELAARLQSGPGGLRGDEAERRLRVHGRNELEEVRAPSRLRVVWMQVKSPLVALLLVAATVSAFTGAWTDAAIVAAIVLASVWLGYSREHHAQVAIASLRERISLTAQVLRDGAVGPVPLAEVVPGDVILLSAGSVVPADARLLEASDLFVDQAVLTGESFPVEKRPGTLEAEAGLARRENCVFHGTHVRTGSGRCLVVDTGRGTHFGQIAARLAPKAPETEFDRGLRHFGYVLLSTMFVMVLFVLVANLLLARPVLETLLFALALAVGLSPELLPAILSVNLAAGAQAMASRGVLVRRLNAIENLGSMDVLCTDKTGTLTEGVVSLEGAYDARGEPCAEVLALAACNAALQAGLSNPLDQAILRAERPAPGALEKLGEVPYDFVRKRLSVVVRSGAGARLITKGAFAHVLEACRHTSEGHPLDAQARALLQRRFEDWSRQGVRVLGVAARPIEVRGAYSRDDEEGLAFAGFLTFTDQPKEGAREALTELRRLGVEVKVITGDSRLVAEHVARQVGLRAERVLTGQQLDEMPSAALWRQAAETELFVEVDPSQKERIILALKKAGHVVGFMGDGVNDAPAMHAADTSVSVEQAADVAKEAADFVLLQRHLDVVRRGIESGRETFANTLKYILTTTSANLGNMISMAVASMFLPFLPLLASQILLNNLLSDVPAVGLAGDSVDPELTERPRRWDMRFIGQFMVAFGLLSSVFDFVTFGALLKLFGGNPELFRTGWFIESLLTELVIALVVRTRRPFYRSRPGKVLWVSTLAVIALTFAIPFIPLSRHLGFVPPPGSLLLTVVAVTALYVVAAERAKRSFFQKHP